MAREILIEKFNPTHINDYGECFWLNKKRERHRNGDGPAVIFYDGRMDWWKNGKRHRNGDKPAVIFPSGRMEWWIDGKRHRDGNRPAIVFSNGKKEYWKNGERTNEIKWLENYL